MKSPEASYRMHTSESIEAVKSGQKYLMLSIATHILGICIGVAFGAIGGGLRVIGVLAVIMALIGVVRVTSGLAYSIGSKILFLVLTFIPFVGFISLLVLISRATEAIRSQESPST